MFTGGSIGLLGGFQRGTDITFMGMSTYVYTR